MMNLDEWNPVLVMTAIDFAFAIVNILLKKVLDEGMNHLVLITYRLSVSAIFLAPIGYFWERNSRPKLTLRILCYLFFSAIVGASLTQYFFLLGIQYTSATFSCAFVNMVPVITYIMALPFGLETMNLKCSSGRAKLLGTLVSVGGAMLLTLYKGMPLFNHSSHSAAAATRAVDQAFILSSSKRTERWKIGSIALMAGTMLWSSWFLVQSKIGKRYPCQYSSTAIMTFFGAIQSAVLCSFTERSFSIWVLKGKIEILTILYAREKEKTKWNKRTHTKNNRFTWFDNVPTPWCSEDSSLDSKLGTRVTEWWRLQRNEGMIGSGLCYVGMAWCVKKKGPVFTAAFSPLIQIMAAMFSIPILHEQFHLGSLLGSIAVIIGLYILLWGKNKEAHCLIMTKLPQDTEDVKNQEPQLLAITVGCDSRCP